MNAIAAGSLTGTTHTGDPLKAAVESLVAVFKADFGKQWGEQFADDGDLRMWKRRAYSQLRGIQPDVIVDGYDLAVQERRPYMPNLVDLVESIKRANGERIRAREQIEEAKAPRFTGGIAGYVEHVLAPNADPGSVAEQCLGMMREILARPKAKDEAERNARLDKALKAHAALIAGAPRSVHRGQVHDCGVCGKPANLTHSVSAKDATWFCKEHWRNG